MIVFLTVVITVIIVFLVEALFLYLLMRLPGVGLHVHLARKQCPYCRSQPAASCSSQVTAASRTGQINDTTRNGSAVICSQQDEPSLDIISETVSASHNLTSSTAAAAAADDDDGDSNNNRNGIAECDATCPNVGCSDCSTCSETVVKRTPDDHHHHHHHHHHCEHTRPDDGVDHQLPCPTRPCSCSCWTTVSSEIRYENEEDGVIVGLYEARVIVPASCPSAPRMNATETHRTPRSVESIPAHIGSTRSSPCKAAGDDNSPGLPQLCLLIIIIIINEFRLT